VSRPRDYACAKVRKFPRHRPFRVLGTRKQSSSPEATPGAEKAAPDPELTFSEAAASTGVRPLAARTRRVRGVATSTAATAVVPARAPSFDLTRADDWLSGYRSELGSNALRRLRAAPSATLDLHGATALRARQMLSAFLTAERARGRSVVLVIVGKGRHSPGGQGVLRNEVADFLTSGSSAEHVLAFETAPPKWGGSGGVLVLLAAPPRAGGPRRPK
jgi:DNA-nicking Smr family endonuclease